MRIYRIPLTAILLFSVLAFAFSPRPDIKTTSTTKLTFKGSLGTMMKMFGGDKPLTTTQYLRGNQSRTDNLDEKGNVTTSTIVDLDREVMINIDHKKKEYTEMTFAEFREMLSKGLGSMSNQPKEKTQGEKDKPEMKWSFDVKVNPTGEKKNVASYPAEKVILTLTAQVEQQAENGESGEMNKGGMVVTSTNWMAAEIKGYEEMKAFQVAYVEKLGMSPRSASFAGMIENAMKSNPQLVEAMQKLQEEGKKLQGVPLMTETVFETWGQPAGQTPEGSDAGMEEQEPPKSVGGLLGGLGKKFAKKPSKEESADGSGRNVLMQSLTEIGEISTASLGADLFVPPANYKNATKK